MVDWINFYSEVCMHWIKYQEPIGGLGSISEIDESEFGKHKQNHGWPKEGV